MDSLLRIIMGIGGIEIFLIAYLLYSRWADTKRISELEIKTKILVTEEILELKLANVKVGFTNELLKMKEAIIKAIKNNH